MGKKNKKPAKPEDFFVCPCCGSVEVKWLVGGQTGDQYKCMKCGYQGIALKGGIGFIKNLLKKGVRGKSAGEKR